MTIMAVITVQHKIPTPKTRINPHHPHKMNVYIHVYMYQIPTTWNFQNKIYYSDDGKLRVINFTENKK